MSITSMRRNVSRTPLPCHVGYVTTATHTICILLDGACCHLYSCPLTLRLCSVGQTLNAVQEARAQVAAFPQQPDMLAIAELIEEEETHGTAAGSNGYHPSESLPGVLPRTHSTVSLAKLVHHCFAG